MTEERSAQIQALAFLLYGRTAGRAPGVLMHVARCVGLRRVSPYDGGGMKCPACGQRCLRLLDEERAPGAPTRLLCGNSECNAGVLMRVDGREGRIHLQEVPGA